MVKERSYTKAEGDETRCKGKGNVFHATVLRKVSAKAHFQLHFWQFKIVSIPGQVFPTVHDNAANKYATCKHSFCTPKHIMWYMQTYVLHTKAYHMVNTNIPFHIIAYHVARVRIHISHQSISPQ